MFYCYFCCWSFFVFVFVSLFSSSSFQVIICLALGAMSCSRTGRRGPKTCTVLLRVASRRARAQCFEVIFYCLVCCFVVVVLTLSCPFSFLPLLFFFFFFHCFLFLHRCCWWWWSLSLLHCPFVGSRCRRRLGC